MIGENCSKERKEKRMTREKVRKLLIELLRQCSELYRREPGSVRRKLNIYPGEIGDAKLIYLTKKYLLKIEDPAASSILDPEREQ